MKKTQIDLALRLDLGQITSRKSRYQKMAALCVVRGRNDPMALGRLLIVAPDPGLRRSLEFAFEAEGYAVAAVATTNEAAVPEGFDCTILDHQAATGPIDDIRSFCRRAQPVVLLVSTPLPRSIGPIFRMVQKPLLGEPLSAAVKDALMAEHGADPQ